MNGDLPRTYHVAVERVDPRTGVALGPGQVLMTARPVPHHEATVITSKITNHPWRRTILVPCSKIGEPT